MQLVLISIAGVIGVLLRYGVILAAPKIVQPGFPWPTLAVNMVGSFIIGAVSVWGLERALLSEPMRLALTIGLLGGFTTFSSFSFESVQMIMSGQWGLAAIYIVLSVGLCMGATGLGIYLVR